MWRRPHLVKLNQNKNVVFFKVNTVVKDFEKYKRFNFGQLQIDASQTENEEAEKTEEVAETTTATASEEKTEAVGESTATIASAVDDEAAKIDDSANAANSEVVTSA